MSSKTCLRPDNRVARLFCQYRPDGTRLRLNRWLLMVLVTTLAVSGVTTGKSELHFARASFQPDSITGVAIVNPNDDSAAVTLTAYDAQGKLVTAPRNPLQIEIGGGEQYASTVLEAFGTPSASADVAWIRAESDSDDLTGFFLYLNSQVSVFDGGEIPEPEPDIVFNQVQVGSDRSTELNLVNTGDEPAAVQLTLYGPGSPVVKQVEIASNGCVRLDAASFFQIASAPPEDRALYVRASASQPLVGFGLVGGDDIIGLSARPRSEQLSHLIFPQLAVLGPFKSELVLVNYSSRSVIARVTAHKPDGTRYEPGAGGNPATLALDPEAALRRDLEALFGFTGSETLDGWLEVEASSQSLNGVLTYSIPSIGSAAGVATVALGETHALFSHIATSLGFYTGVAALNPGTLAANLEVAAHRPDGTLVGSFSTVLRPGERVSRLIDEFVPQAADMAGGFIRVTSDLPLYVTSLFGSLESGVLANIPPQRLPAEFKPDSGAEAIAVDPRIAVLQPGREQIFTSGIAGPITWSVNSVPGGDSEFGTIDTSGRYRAPESSPASLPVTIAAASGSRTAGASVDILSKSELLSGLGLIQTLAYLQSARRLFAAEVSGVSAASTRFIPATGERTAILDLTQGIRVEVAAFEDESISEMVPYVASDGLEYLVMTAESSGSVIRLNPLNGTYQTVLAGLSEPSSLVIDDLEDRLLVAEAEEVSSYPMSVLETGLKESSVDGVRLQSGGRRLLLAARRGRLAVDRCTGNILVSVKDDGVILELNRLTGAVRTVASDLRQPGALLGFYRRGVSCPAAFHLLVSEREGGRLTIVVPTDGTVKRWIDASDATSLEFLSEGNPLTGTSGVVLSETGALGSTVRFVPLPGIYLVEAGNPLERKALPPCTIQQITASAEAELGRAAISEPGDAVVVSSTGDPLGENPEGNEELFLLTQGFKRPVQLTHTAAGRNWNPVLSPDGRLVMFKSNAVEAGSATSQASLILMDISLGTTSVLAGDTVFPGSFDRSGLWLSYTASGDPAGTNREGNPEVYLYSVEAKTLTQLTNSAAGASFSSQLSADGTRLSFLSTANLQGSNPGGNTVLFLADRTQGSLLQVSPVAAGTVLPDEQVFFMDESASLLAFNSKLDLLGENPKHDWAVYLFDTASSELRQVNSSRYPARVSSLDSRGGRMAMTSTGNPLRLNRDGNLEILIWNLGTQRLEQVTRSRRVLNSGGLLSGDGERLLFISNGDLTGANPDRGPELFLGNCPRED